MNYIGCSGFYEHTHAGWQNKWTGLLFQLPSFFKYSDENLQKVLWTIDRRFVNEVEFRLVRWWCDEVKIALKEANIVIAGVTTLLKSVDKSLMMFLSTMTTHYIMGYMPCQKCLNWDIAKMNRQLWLKSLKILKGKGMCFLTIPLVLQVLKMHYFCISY